MLVRAGHADALPPERVQRDGRPVAPAGEPIGARRHRRIELTGHPGEGDDALRRWVDRDEARPGAVECAAEQLVSAQRSAEALTLEPRHADVLDRARARGPKARLARRREEPRPPPVD